MTKEEFLEGLKRALFSTGSQSLIEYNLDYYSSYIDGEIAKGRSMDDVMNELGDPRLIANSIKVAEGYSDVFVGLEDEVIEEMPATTKKIRILNLTLKALIKITRKVIKKTVLLKSII